MIEEVESSELERQSLEQRSQMHNDELLSIEQELRSLQQSNQFYEQRIQELNRGIEDRDSRIMELVEQ